MSSSIFALPVSVEQIAAAINQMQPAEQRRLLELSPGLRQIAQPLRTLEQAQSSAARLQAEIAAALNQQPLSPDAPFVGGLSLRQYIALPDAKKSCLWDEWANADLTPLDEREVAPDALLAG